MNSAQREDDFPRRLAARLRQPLPGAAVQAPLQPELSFGRYFAPPPASAQRAAVVALLYPRADAWHLPLTLRPGHLAQHAGQISLPGGLVEPDEESHAAALRELREELGVNVHGVRMLGRLSPIYLYRSNYSIVPWIAAVDRVPDWRPSADEVAQLLEFPLERLLEPECIGRELRTIGGVSFEAPCFCLGEHSIWGATSLILAELRAVAADAGLQ